MDVDDWVGDVPGMHPVRCEDGRSYVAVVYDGDADVVPDPVFRTFSRDAVERADAPRYVDTARLQADADGYGYGDAVARWVEHGVLPAHDPPEPPWDRALRYAGSGAHTV